MIYFFCYNFFFCR